MAMRDQAMTTRDLAMIACIKCIFLRVFYIDGAAYLVILGFLKFPVVFIVSECFQSQWFPGLGHRILFSVSVVAQCCATLHNSDA